MDEVIPQLTQAEVRAFWIGLAANAVLALVLIFVLGKKAA
jgi:hypothetical protein